MRLPIAGAHAFRDPECGHRFKVESGKWKGEQWTDQHRIRPVMPGHSHKRRTHDRPRDRFSYLM